MSERPTQGRWFRWRGPIQLDELFALLLHILPWLNTQSPISERYKVHIGINNAGTVVGLSRSPNGNSVGIVWSGTTITTLGLLPKGFNNAGEVVGLPPRQCEHLFPTLILQRALGATLAGYKLSFSIETVPTGVGMAPSANVGSRL
jgi:hypothetical protein